MMTGTGIFYDGLTSDRHKVTVDIAGDAIEVKTPDGSLLVRWRIDEAYPLATSNEVLRIGVASAKSCTNSEATSTWASGRRERPGCGVASRSRPGSLWWAGSPWPAG